MAEPEPAEEPAEEPAAATEAPEAGPEAEPEMAAEKAAAELAPELEAEPEPLGDPNPVPAVNFAGDPTTAADLPTWLGTLGLPADHLRDFLPQLRDNGFETVASLVEPPITDADLKELGLTKLRARKVVLGALAQLANELRPASPKLNRKRATPRPPSRMPAAAAPKTPEEALRQAVLRIDRYQKPHVTLQAVMSENVEPGEPINQTWFRLTLQSKLALRLSEQQLDDLFVKYGGTDRGIDPAKFARGVFSDGKQDVRLSSDGKGRPGRRLYVDVGPSDRDEAAGRKTSGKPRPPPSGRRRPQSAGGRMPEWGAPLPAESPRWRESAETILTREQQRGIRASIVRQQAIDERAMNSRAMTERVKVVQRRKRCDDRQRKSKVAADRMSKDPSTNAADETGRLMQVFDRYKRNFEALAGAAGGQYCNNPAKLVDNPPMDRKRFAMNCVAGAYYDDVLAHISRRERGLRQRASTQKAHTARVRSVNRRHRHSVEDLKRWADDERAAPCTFRPVTGGKVRYSHVRASSARRAQDSASGVRSSIGDRALEKQRHRIDFIKQKRGSAVQAQTVMSVRDSRQSVLGGKSASAGQEKHLRLDAAFRRGPFTRDAPDEWKFGGMIKYLHCKQSVMVPTYWPQVCKKICERATKKPDIWLQLEHVFGYNGPKNVQPNVNFVSSGEILYYTSAVGILYNSETNTQRFYIGHEDEISCMALHPDKDTVATGGTGSTPKILIWSATTMRAPEGLEEPKHELELAQGDQYVLCMAFSPDGKHLITISANEEHTIRIWDWKAKKLVEGGEGKGNRGTAPQVYGVVWNPCRGQPKQHFDFVTFGHKHLSFWTFTVGGQPVMAKKDASYGKVGERQHVHHATFLQTGQLVSAGDNGKLMLWEKNKAVLEIDAHTKGPCKCVKLRQDGKTLLSAGGDGCVIVWSIEMAGEGDLFAGLGDAIRTQDPEITKRQLELVKNVVNVLQQAVKDENRQLFSKSFATTEELFKAMDHDENGNLGQQEFQAAVNRLGLGLTQEQVDLIWGLMDPDGGGSLDFAEFMALFQLEERLIKIINSDAVELKESKRINLADPEDPDGPQTITTVDTVAGKDDFVAADSENDIWEVDDNPRVMVEGQSGHVFGLSPHPKLSRVYATACADGHIGLWDAEHRRNIKMIRVERGVPSREQRKSGMGNGDHLQAWACCFSADGKMLAVSTNGVVGDDEQKHPDIGGVFIVYECLDAMFEWSEDPNEKMYSPQKIFETKDMLTTIDDMAFSPNNLALAVGSHDRFIDVYVRIDGAADGEPQFRHSGRCRGHSSTIRSLDWSVDSLVLRSTSADKEVMHWDVEGKLFVDPGAQRDTEWARWTSTIGFPVMGIFGPGMGANDVKHCYRSNNQQWVVVADDAGLVRLNNYPAVVQHTPGYAHKGHASHIDRVCFLADDTRVVSCGGHDQATYQWKVRGPGKPKPEDKVKAAAGMMAGMAAFAMAGSSSTIKPKPKPPPPQPLKAAEVANAAMESLDNLLAKLGSSDGGGDSAAEIAALRESMQSLGSLAGGGGSK